MGVLLSTQMTRLEPTTVLVTAMLSAHMISSLFRVQQTPKDGKMESESSVHAAWSSICGRQTASLKLLLHILALLKSRRNAMVLIVEMVKTDSRASATKTGVISAHTGLEIILSTDQEVNLTLTPEVHSLSLLSSLLITSRMMEKSLKLEESTSKTELPSKRQQSISMARNTILLLMISVPMS